MRNTPLTAEQVLDALGGDWLQPVKNELADLRARLRQAEAVLATIRDDMMYKPVHFDWPSHASVWFKQVTQYFTQEQK